jgi:hypothetical protein
MGSTVGPALSARLTGWTVEGISYSADLSGIYCMGLQGGIKCLSQIKKVTDRCPKTNIVLSGYSQGAMVARECAAYTDDKIRAQIKVNTIQAVFV